ncbi:hypothetical protein SLEP1_g17385 [Rubroshorea leprosula]|uniref:Mitochondrial protein n=1 Tax=Rubroshorea leprosula TaxID=152421 RepID=A0AAV5IXT4_9ROSI|nr:hypothetical protein SLEP1_g17385 [Rubroshorea leprosula]
MKTRGKAKVGLLHYSASPPISIPKEPRTLKIALTNSGWYEAMKEELNALQKNKTWTLVPRTDSMNVIGSKWVFKTKLKADGTLERLKARLELSYAVNSFCQFMHSLPVGHFQLVKWILHYVKGTIDQCLHLLKDNSLDLYGLSNADWASCPLTRRSVTRRLDCKKNSPSVLLDMAPS